MGKIKTGESIIKEAKNNGEPTFTIRAKDIASMAALFHYKEECRRIGCENEFINDIERIIDEFLLWRKHNKIELKRPD